MAWGVDVNLASHDTFGEQRADNSLTDFGKMGGGTLNMGGNPTTNMGLIIGVGAVLIIGMIVYLKSSKKKK